MLRYSYAMTDEYSGFIDLIDEIVDDANKTKATEQNTNSQYVQEQLLNYLDSEIQSISENVFSNETTKAKATNTNLHHPDTNKQLNGNLDLAVGHRQRAKERFLASPNTISDVDLLELILFLLIPRADTKPIAKKLLLKFKTYKGIMMAREEEITENGINGKNVKYLFTLLHTFYSRYFSQHLTNEGIDCSNIHTLVQYCHGLFCDKQEEEFHILFFNNQLQLLANKPFGINGVSNVSLDVRAIIKMTFDLHAKNIVLTHNHPSGTNEPSQDDIKCTEEIKNFMKTIDVKLIDHIIISNDGYFSFTEHHLI